MSTLSDGCKKVYQCITSATHSSAHVFYCQWARQSEKVTEFLIKNGRSLHNLYRGPQYAYLKPLAQAIMICPNPFAANLIIKKKRQRGNLPYAKTLILMAAVAT